MKLLSLLPACFIFLTACSSNYSVDTNPGELFDSGWKFHRGDIPGAERNETGVEEWRSVNLPHDWSIENIPGTESPFDSTVENGVASGFTRGGTGWYRKHFRLENADKDKTIRLLFDGVYMNSDIWINGHHAGGNFYGYSGFPVDITPYARFGEDNVVAVKVENNSVKCRWYSGSGIYRHVWLTRSGRISFSRGDIQVITPLVSEKQALVRIKGNLANDNTVKGKARIQLVLLSKNNHKIALATVSAEIEANRNIEITHDFIIKNPALWSVDSPTLYKLVVKVSEGKNHDEYAQDFGIRKIEYNAKDGLLLNGKPVKLKGGCIHHDNGALGACAYDRAEERKIELLKSAGFNCIRFAHNPPSPAILDACDRLGMLAIDESFDVWKYGHFEGDYSAKFDSLWKKDIEYMVRRDRNHPSVIMWSIGNEIKKSETPEIAETCMKLAGLVKTLDYTRPVTSAVNNISVAKDTFFSYLDIGGYNYAPFLYEADHERVPDRIMYGSESFAWQAYDYWKQVEDHPWVIGDFVWTAFDYIGEASIGWRGYPQEQNFYPWNLAWCGDIDITGHRRPQSYYRQTLWDSHPVTALFVEPPETSFPVNPNKADWSVWDWPDVVQHWNFEGYEGKALNVSVYTSATEAELFLNGKSLGRKQKTAADKNRLIWQVPYSKGILSAIGYTDGKKDSEAILETAYPVQSIEMRADRSQILANSQDLAFIDIELQDEEGRINPGSDRLIHFDVSGSGTLLAVANANPMSTESFQLPQRMTWRGRCQVIVKAGFDPGIIKVKASSKGLPEKVIEIRVK
ncbi:MAG TPA: glycoside hydrolase family 2 TIM barrel-domain containing protein [Bacteroidales bacterium]|nr:glycoside hydrolase family 2 TIM barrel-domain containing protein [Bacteroidales bacterium]